ncbi:MAG: PEP-CTERM/exosortase system-associated acyltransferase [Candidatus Binatia bacterium]
MFDKHFETVLADTDAGRDIHYRLRYQVYCVEAGYEDPEVFRDEMERDRFDENSVHFIVRRKATGDWIAAVRLVVGPLCSLPLSEVARIEPGRISEITAGNVGNVTRLCAEVSRLCVVSDFRRRIHERKTVYQLAEGPIMRQAEILLRNRRQAPWIMLGLLRAAREYSLRQGIFYWFFLVTGSLVRLLQSQGVDLSVVGQQCNHRGIRRPHLGDIRTGFDSLRIKSPAVHGMFFQRPSYRLFSELEEESAREIAANE